MTTTSTQFSLLSPKSWFSWQAVRDNFLPWVVPVGALIIWQILAQIGWLSTRILPSPTVTGNHEIACQHQDYDLKLSAKFLTDLSVAIALLSQWIGDRKLVHIIQI
jgi:ABC-type nitrate/sulfonate/bicarbonate transport system permease component